MIEQTLFELLQVAVGNRTELSATPQADEWKSLYDACQRQSLAGIGFVGVQKLPEWQWPQDEDFFLEWVALASAIEQRNSYMCLMCHTVTEQIRTDGFGCCVLKGQGNLADYPEELRAYRASGDIDLWCWDTSAARGDGILPVIDYARSLAEKAGIHNVKLLYHHTDLIGVWPVSVEIHHRPSFMCSPICNHRFQKWCTEVRDNVVNEVCMDGYAFPAAATDFNLVYQLSHIFHHLFDSGIGLRQFLDYYMVLRAWYENRAPGSETADNACLMTHIERFGMGRFASAVMYVLQKVFAMPDKYLICEPDIKEGEFLLRELLLAGNFGVYDKRLSHSKSRVRHAWDKLFRNYAHFLAHYPREVLCEPFFRLWHFFWRVQAS